MRVRLVTAATGGETTHLSRSHAEAGDVSVRGSLHESMLGLVPLVGHAGSAPEDASAARNAAVEERTYSGPMPELLRYSIACGVVS
jgi:hypothetical protein